MNIYVTNDFKEIWFMWISYISIYNFEYDKNCYILQVFEVLKAFISCDFSK